MKEAAIAPPGVMPSQQPITDERNRVTQYFGRSFHILKHLLRCGAIAQLPTAIGTRRAYLQFEQTFFQLADSFGLKPQELDLLLWILEEGSVRK